MATEKGRKDKQWHKTVDRKLKIEQHVPNWNPGVNSGAPADKQS